MNRSLPLIASSTALIAAAYGLARFGYGLFVPMFMADFGLTATITGAISSGGFIAYCVAAAAAFRMAGSPASNVLLAGLTATLGSIGVALSPTPAILALSVLVAGSGAGFASPGTVALVERSTGVTVERKQAIVNAGTGFGVILAGPLALVFSENWRTAWWLIAAISATATVATLLNNRRSARARPAPAPEIISAGIFKPLGWAAVCAALGGASTAAVWTFGRSTVETAGQLSATEATLFWTLLGAAGVGGAISGDLVIRWGLRAGWITGSLALAFATGIIGAFPSLLVAAYLAAAVFGASYVALTGVLIAWASRAVPGRASAGTAVLFIALAAGQSGGAVLIGFLLDLAPAVVAFGCAALIAVASLVPAVVGTPAGNTVRRPAPVPLP